MSKNDLTQKVKELKELEVMAKELQDEIDTIKDSIKAEMQEKGTDTLQADIFTIRYKEVKGVRFDTKAFKMAYNDLYNAFSKETVSKRFSIA